MINVVEDKIQEVILEILNKNYGELADIRCGFYGDENSFYLYNGFVATVSMQRYTYLINDCTFKYLEEKIKSIIDPVKEASEYLQKFLDVLPENIKVPCMSFINRGNNVKRLCIYFSDCGVMDNEVMITLGCTII